MEALPKGVWSRWLTEPRAFYMPPCLYLAKKLSLPRRLETHWVAAILSPSPLIMGLNLRITRTSRKTTTLQFTLQTRILLGNAAPMRTSMDCCASFSPRAPTFFPFLLLISPTSFPSSTTVLANASVGFSLLNSSMLVALDLTICRAPLLRGRLRGNPERGRRFANRTCVGAEPPQGQSQSNRKVACRNFTI